VLDDIGASDVRQILVFNKTDAVPELRDRAGTVERDEYGNISRVFLSAREGLGLDALRAAITEAATTPALGPALSDQSDIRLIDIESEPIPENEA